MKNVVNISGYKFIPLEKIATLGVDLRKKCLDLGLKGTILLSPEGINIALCGNSDAIHSFVAFIHQDSRFADIAFKKSYAEHAPFSRMLVKTKNEIVTMGVPDLHSPSYPENTIEPKILKQMMDEGEEFILLDTRNDYEYKIGSFEKAKLLKLKNFREFPDVIEQFSENDKQKPMVMFCTGGVRCEKAMPFLQQKGFNNIYQLHGGILKYFEECGGAYWQGECFVFDDRISVTPELKETGTKLCECCQMPITMKEQQRLSFEKHHRCSDCQIEK